MKRPHAKDSNSHHAVKTLKTEASQQRPSLRVPLLSDFQAILSAPLIPVAPRVAKPATELVQHHALARSVTPTLTKMPYKEGSGYNAYLKPSPK